MVRHATRYRGASVTANETVGTQRARQACITKEDDEHVYASDRTAMNDPRSGQETKKRPDGGYLKRWPNAAWTGIGALLLFPGVPITIHNHSQHVRSHR